jgi:hypothetical protein
MAYSTPRLTPYGSVSARTGVFGAVSAGDTLVNENGQTVLSGQLSIDACAESGGKCICTDNGTC